MTFRQIPLETVFNSNDANSWRDPLRKNRIHFRFPESWTNNVNKDSIIGIRDMFITKGYRNLNLDFEIKVRKTTKITANKQGSQEEQLISENTTTLYSIKQNIIKVFTDETKITDILEKFHSFVNPLNKTEVSYNDTTYKNVFCRYLKPETGLTNGQKLLIDNYAYIAVYYIFENHESYFIINCPYNSQSKEDRTVLTTEEDTDEQGQRIIRITRNIYDIQINITNISQDAEAILNFTPSEVENGISTTEPIIKKDVWDRDSCILYSSLAYMSNNSYLGHTRKHSLPKIKYYELTSSNKTFWVDLYATRDHESPVYLPEDNKDELYIEAQLLTSQQAVF